MNAPPLTLAHRTELQTIVGTHPIASVHPSIRLVGDEVTPSALGRTVLVGDTGRLYAVFARSRSADSNGIVFERTEYPQEKWSDAEVSSIKSGTYWDGFERKPFIAATFVKGDTTASPITAKAHLALYGLNSRTSLLSDILDDVVSIELNFIPFKMEYYCHNTPDVMETILLIPGSDAKLHIFSISPMGISPIQTDPLIQEIGSLTSSIMTMDLRYYDGIRICVVGCMNGYTQITFQDRAGELHRHFIYLDGPISGVRLFTENYDKKLECIESFMSTEAPKTLFDLIHELSPGQYKNLQIRESSKVNLVVAGASGFAIVYRDVLSEGFGSAFLLPESDMFDCVTFADPIDVNCDGTFEIIIGTFARQLHVYKKKKELQGEIAFELHSKLHMPDAPLCCGWVDLTGDGIKELIVTGIYGISIYQTDHEAAAERLKMILDAAEAKAEPELTAHE